jgi:hypothetical protein
VEQQITGQRMPKSHPPEHQDDDQSHDEEVEEEVGDEGIQGFEGSRARGLEGWRKN